MNRGLRLGITGGHGFLGWHLRCRVRRAGWPEPLIADRATFADPAALRSFVERADAIVHLAAVNRAASDEEVADGNRELATRLAEAVRFIGPRPVVYSNTIKSLEPGPYGEAKAEAAGILGEALADTGGPFADAVLPHIFGEFGVPFYNSAVTTFAYQLAIGEEPVLQTDATLELLHAQDAADLMLKLVLATESIIVRPPGHHILVSEAKALLEAQHRRYVDDATVPSFGNRFEQRLFNTLRSQLFANGTQSFPLTRHTDHRGFFAELTRSDGLGQSSISASASNITRGDHFHLEKIERFVVISGRARIRIRRLLTDEIHVFDVDGDEPVAIDMPPLCTHNITNTGSGELLTYFWAGDHFDPENPDTFGESVEPAPEPRP